MGSIEVRGFGELKKLFEEREWPYPLLWELEGDISAFDLAGELGIPPDRIEIVFVNGKASPLDYQVKPGDRVAFVPPGTPGPYRVLLGFKKMGEQ